MRSIIMKKKIMKIITFLIISVLIGVQPVFAQTSVGAKLNANHIELKANESVEITLSLNNFKDIKKGINAIKGTLEYDTNIFEEVFQSDFIGQNSWEDLKYNAQNNEFVLYRKVGTKSEENVLKIVLKVKEDIEATKTLVKLKNISTSEGKKDILLTDVNIELNIIKEQETIPDKPISPVSPEKPNTDNTITNNTKPSGNLSGNIIGSIVKPNPDDTINNNNPNNQMIHLQVILKNPKKIKMTLWKNL